MKFSNPPPPPPQKLPAIRYSVYNYCACLCVVHMCRLNSLVAELPYGWERVDDPMYGVYFVE